MLLTVSLFCFYRQTFTLNIRVTDRGNPPLSSSSQLEIEVTDENDNAPVFSLASYRATVRENTPQGTSFFKASYQMNVPFSSLTQHFALSEKLFFTLEMGMGRTGVEFSWSLITAWIDMERTCCSINVHIGAVNGCTGVEYSWSGKGLSFKLVCTLEMRGWNFPRTLYWSIMTA